MAPHNRFWQPEFTTNRANLIFKQGAKWLDQVKLEVIGKATNVVVTLDDRSSGTPATLNDVGIEGALNQELHLRPAVLGFSDNLRSSTLKRSNELPANNLPLRLRVTHTGKRGEELVPGIHGDESNTGCGNKVFLHLLALSQTQKAMVDEHTDKLISDSLMHQCGGNGGVDTTRETTDHQVATDLVGNSFDLVSNDVVTVPTAIETHNFVEEVLQHSLPMLGVLHFGVPLHPEHLFGL